MKNLGVIEGSRPTDYIAGALPYEERNPSGDWTPYLPIGEIQRGKEDWMDCVTRSLTNSIEIQEKFLTGKEAMNYNDREVALGSKTTREGNMLWRVAEYVRKTGLALQATWPDSGGNFDEQYAAPAADVRARLDQEKRDWLFRWDIKDEDIPVDRASLKYHLKHAPIQVTIPGHAVVDILSEAAVDRIFDSYPPYTKDVPSGPAGSIYRGPIKSAKKVVLYKREEAVPDSHLLVDIKYLDAGKQFEKLKNALHGLGWMPDTRRYPAYDGKMAELVLNFQKANLSRQSWAYWFAIFYYRGRLVDAETRRVINEALSNHNL